MTTVTPAAPEFDFDLLIIGAGPAGLAAAIHAARAAAAQPITICVLEKAAEIGAHTLSGAVINPRALPTLLPGGLPAFTPVREERFLLRTASREWHIPGPLIPPALRHTGQLVGSLGELCRALAAEAQALGVELYTGFAAAGLLFDTAGQVCGVRTGEFGRLKSGVKGPGFQPGAPLRARLTLLAEGAAGSLSREATARFGLRAASAPASYALGFRELWRIPRNRHRPGRVEHALGWPLAAHTSGGAYCYHYGEDLLALGLVCGLEYRNPWFSPFDEAQRLKTHPALRTLLEGGECLGFGARVLAQGGLPALPRLTFPGGALIGDAAGLLDAARTQGIHAALESGIMAADAAVQALRQSSPAADLAAYAQAFTRSPLRQELWRSRNFKPWLKRGWAGMLAAGAEQWLSGGHVPWTLRGKPDSEQTGAAARYRPLPPPPRLPGLLLSRDEALALARVRHTEDQPAHLLVEAENLEQEARHTGGVEAHCCPAGVYAFEAGEHGPRLSLTPSNCLHCKCCEIKSPSQAVRWVPPQGGEGPFYSGM